MTRRGCVTFGRDNAVALDVLPIDLFDHQLRFLSAFKCRQHAA